MQNVNGKKAYASPQLKEWGNVTHVTAALGMTYETDAALTGSMADVSGGNAGGGGKP